VVTVPHSDMKIVFTLAAFLGRHRKAMGKSTRLIFKWEIWIINCQFYTTCFLTSYFSFI